MEKQALRGRLSPDMFPADLPARWVQAFIVCLRAYWPEKLREGRCGLLSSQNFIPSPLIVVEFLLNENSLFGLQA